MKNKAGRKLMAVLVIIIFTLTSSLAVPITKASGHETSRTRIKELVDKRTSNQRVYLNSDGTYTADIYSGPVNYKNGNKYDVIDNSLVKVDVNNGSKDIIYKNKANSFNTYFNNNLNSEQPVKLQFGKYNIGLKPAVNQSNVSAKSSTQLLGKKTIKRELQENNSNVTAENKSLKAGTNNQAASNQSINDNTLSPGENADEYEDTYKSIEYDGTYDSNINLQYSPTSTGIKGNIVLNSYTDINKFDFTLTLDGLIPEVEDDGNIWLIDKSTNEIEGSIPRAYMYDSSKEFSHVSDNVKTEITDNGNGKYTLTLTADKQFLKSKSVVYPVVIDPSVSVLDSNYGNDAYIESWYPTQNYSNNESRTIRVGDWNPGDGTDCGIMRSFIKFPSLPAIGGGIVLSASLKLHVSGNYSDMSVDAYLVKDSWNASTATWNNTAGTAIYSNHATANISSGPGYYTWNLTELASAWYSNVSTNKGIELVDTNESTNTHDFMAFDAWNSSYPPQLSITYSLPNTTITCAPYGNKENSSTGYVKLSWSAIPGASKYYVEIFNGKSYEYFDAGSSITWNTQGKGIWPTITEISSGRYQLHHDSHGTELPNDPVNTYIKSGGPYGTRHNYWFRIAPVNSYGQVANIDNCSCVTPTLPDTTAPNSVQNAILSFNQVPHNDAEGYIATVTWSAAADLPASIASGIDHYNIELHDTTEMTSSFATTSGTNCSFNNVKDGHNYYATITAIDAKNNSSSSSTTQVCTQDRTGPSAPSTFTIANNGYSNNDSINISWAGILDESGISVVQYKITDNNSLIVKDWTTTGSQSADAQEVPISLTKSDGSRIADGDYKIWLRGVDNVKDSNGISNYGDDSAYVILHEDTSIPDAEIIFPVMQQSVNGFVNITGKVSEQSLSKWILEYGQGQNPGNYTTIASGTNNMPDNSTLGLWDTLCLPNGVYTLKLTVVDMAGNNAICKVLVNKAMTMTIPAKLVIDSPANGSVITSPDKISIKLHRTDGGTLSALSLASYVNNIQNPSMQISPNQGDLFIDPTQYAEGSTNSLYVKGWDGNGNNYYSTTTYGGDNTPYKGQELTNGSFNDASKLENYTNVSLSGTDIVLNSGATSGSVETKTVSVTGGNPATGIAINANSFLPANSYLTFDVSSDGGKSWQNNVSANQVVYFNNPGKYIKIRAKFGTTQVLSVQPKIIMLNAGVIIVDNETDINPAIAYRNNLSKFEISLDGYWSTGGVVYSVPIMNKSIPSLEKTAPTDDYNSAGINSIISPPTNPSVYVYYPSGYGGTNPISVSNLDHIILTANENKPDLTTITYSISTDGGSTWNNVQLNTPIKIDRNVISIALRVSLTTDNSLVTPTVSNLQLQTFADVYSYNAETLADSLNKFTVKLINEPTDVSATPNVNYTTLLRWTPSTTDGVYYNIYRDTQEDFVTSASNRIASNITDAYWNDFNITQQSKKYYYKVTAVKSFNGQFRESVPSKVCFANSISSDELKKRLGLENQWGFSNFRTGDGQGYINLSNGNLCYQVTDFIYPGPILAEVMKRSFNSQADTKTPLGYGWDFGFNTNLLKEYDANGNEIGMILKDGDGSIHVFTKNPDGTFNTPKPLDMKLSLENNQYVITRNDNIKYYFDNNLRLQKFTEPNGNTLTITYDSIRGNISAVTNSVGKAISFTYDNVDKIKTITDPAGRKFIYNYDESSNRLQYVTIDNENGIPHQDKYIYDPTYTNLDNIVDPNGNTTNIQYDAGNVREVTDPEGQYFSFDYSQPYTTVVTSNTGYSTFIYDDNGSITSKTDELGHTTNYSYWDDNYSDLFYGKIKQMSYVNIINGVEKTITYNYTYDKGNGNLASEAGPLNSQTTYSNYNKFNEPGEVDKYVSSDHTKVTKTIYNYDDKGNLLSSIGPENKTVSYTYDSMGNRLTMTDNFGNITKYEYDAFGRLTKTTEPLEKVTQISSYDDQGNPTEIIDPNGNITDYQYDILGRLRVQTSMDSTKTEKREIQKYYDMNGNLIESIDGRGYNTTYKYDGDDRQISITAPDGKTTSAQYVNDPDNSNCLIVTETDAAGRKTTKYYDKLQRVYKEISGAAINTYQYDYIGNMISSTDSEGRESDAVYNDLNQQVKTISDPKGQNIQNSYTYDLMGNKLTSTDGEGNTTTNTYDLLGRLLTVKVSVNTDGSKKDEITSYSYDNVERDANNQFIDAYNTVTDAMNRVTATYFDALGRKIEDVKEGIPGTQGDKPMIASYQYDLNGNLKTLTEPDDKSKVNYTYDCFNEVKTETYNDNNFLTYSYDENGNKSAVELINNGITSTINYQYYADNKLMETTQDGITVDYQYDGSNNLTQVSYADGSTTKNLIYDFDNYNRLQDIKLQTDDNSAEKVRDYAYVSPKGTGVLTNKVSTITNYLQFDTSGTGTEKINYSYNSIGIPGSICYNVNGTDKEKYTLDYDKNGNIKTETVYTAYDSAKTITKQYSYDEIGELLSVLNTDSSTNLTKTTSYTYDLVGNRLTMTQDSDKYEYNYNDFNQLLNEYKNKSANPDPITAITYDDNGNEKTDISKKDVDGKQKTYTTNYTFNSANQLVGETVDDGTTKNTIENSYDGTGNRVQEYVTTMNDDGSTTNAQPAETKYFYLGQNLLFTADKDNQKGEENILDPNGQIVSSKRFDGVYANNYFFYNYDIRGSVTNIIDPSGKLVKGYDYDEFGNTRDSDETKNNNFKNEVKFTGAIEDQSAGLYYMNSRFYNPSSGRFISQDTYSGSADEPWTQHLYNYTSNNPVNMVDPTGHAPTHPVIVADGGGEEPRPDPGEPQPWYVNLGITAAGIVVVGAGYALLSTGVYEVGAAVPTVASTGTAVISYLGDKFSDVLYKGYNITSAVASKALSQLQEIMNWGEEEGTNAPDIVEKGVGNAVKTSYGDAIQDMSEEALKLKNSVNEGSYIYRAGQFGRSNTMDAQFWAPENPLNPGYAEKYGVDFKNIDYIIRGKINTGADFITRQAPGLGSNIGGALEIVTNPYDVITDSFIMP